MNKEVQKWGEAGKHLEPTPGELRYLGGEADSPLKPQDILSKMTGELIRNALDAEVSDISWLS